MRVVSDLPFDGADVADPVHTHFRLLANLRQQLLALTAGGQNLVLQIA